MKNLLILFITLLSIDSFAQLEKDSIPTYLTYELQINKAPDRNKPKKQPVYHEFKVIGGIIFASSGYTDFNFKDQENPFNFGQNLLPNICIITNKTYHNFVYGFANNTIKVVNGYPFGQSGLDVYLVPGIHLSSGTVCTSVGIEKVIKAGDVNFYLFSELEKDFSDDSNLIMYIGFHVNIQEVLHRKNDHSHEILIN